MQLDGKVLPVVHRTVKQKDYMTKLYLDEKEAVGACPLTSGNIQFKSLITDTY